MNECARKTRDYRFLTGLFTGTLVGAGLAALFAPRLALERQQRVSGSARHVGDRASERCPQVSARVGKAVEEVARKGQDLRDDVADTVARNAHEVERDATAGKADRVTEGRKHSLVDSSVSTPNAL